MGNLQIASLYNPVVKAVGFPATEVSLTVCYVALDMDRLYGND